MIDFMVIKKGIPGPRSCPRFKPSRAPFASLGLNPASRDRPQPHPKRCCITTLHGVKRETVPAKPNPSKGGDGKPRLLASCKTAGPPKGNSHGLEGRNAMKKLLMFLGLLVITPVVVGVGSAHADPADVIKVYGTGDPAIDIPSVQEAVDNYRKVHLYGIFSFEEVDADFLNYRGEAVYMEKNVVITKSVDIKGHGAKIIGGSCSFSIGGDARRVFTYPQTTDAIVKIDGIHFENPHFAAIYAIGSAGLEVKNNTFMDGKPRDTLAEEIWFYPVNSHIFVGSFNHGLNSSDVRGYVKIHSNYMDSLARYVDSSDPYAISFFGNWFRGFTDNIYLMLYDAKADVKNNTLKNVFVMSLETFGNMDVCVVSDNVIEAGEYALNGAGAFDGIAPPFFGTAPVYFTHNTVTVTPPNPFFGYNSGIFNSQKNCVVDRNTIQVNGGFSGILLGNFNTGSENLVTNNKIQGAGQVGIYVDGPFAGLESTGSSFLKNDLDDYSPFAADLYFGPDTQDNLFVGIVDDAVMDLGVNNTIVNAHRVPGDLKDDVKDKIQAAREAMQGFYGQLHGRGQ
jgi:hypothetical protein